MRILGYEDRKLWLGNLIVASRYRGQGIARTLLEAAYDQARRLNYKNISLFTTVADASYWYEKQGWQQFAVDQYQ